MSTLVDISEVLSQSVSIYKVDTVIVIKIKDMDFIELLLKIQRFISYYDFTGEVLYFSCFCSDSITKVL